jgi:polysaccharide biosynthesis/export protein
MMYIPIRTALLLLLVSGSKLLSAQFMMPGMGGMGGMGNLMLPVDTPKVNRSLQILQSNNAKKDTAAGKPEDPDVLKIRQAEREVQKLEIQARKGKIEKELAELKRKDSLTTLDKELIGIKNENLRIIYEKERLLLLEELSAARAVSRDFPEAAVYGQQYFRTGPSRLIEAGSNLNVPDGYVLGTGDMVHIEVWGFRYWSGSYVVGESGSIDISGYQKIFVKGLTLKQAREIIGSRIGAGGSTSYLVTVTKPRNITVNLLGEVFNPGAVNVTALNSAFNILAATGGPTNIGTVRSIYIKRSGMIIDSLDVYKYLTDGRELYLQNQDAIVVGPAQKIVQISGGIQKAGIYELKGVEKLSDLIRFAGGIMPVTYTRDVMVTRIVDNQYFERISVNYDSLAKTGKDFDLRHGDEVVFRIIRDDKNYLVKVMGGVNIPGEYKIRKGDRISKVLKLSNGLMSTAYAEKAYLIRTNADLTRSFLAFSPKNVLANPGAEEDMVLEERDIVNIYSRRELLDSFSVTLGGEVRKPLEIEYVDGLRMSQLLFMGGGFTEEAERSKGFIVRTDENYNKKLISFSPQEAFSYPGSEKDPILQPSDLVKIYSRKEYQDFFTCKIEGAVRKPVTIDYTENVRISDMVYLGGGLLEGAFMERALLIRVDPIYLIQTTKSLNLREIMENPGSEEDLLLQPRDILRIFNKLEMRDKLKVSISGEVRKPGDYDYSDDLSLKDLIYIAGGFTYAAANAKIEIVRHSAPIEPVYWIPTKTLVFTSSVPVDLIADRESDKFKLVPFDQVFVRSNPEYVPNQVVTLNGAVMFPGQYTLMGNGERISSVVKRAGGLRPEAYSPGATFKRKGQEEKYMNVVIDMRKALMRKRSDYNYTLKNGDIIDIPYAEELVILTGEINTPNNDRLASYYVSGKRAGYYIRNIAGGFTENALRRKVTVIHKNGRVSQSRNFVLFKTYPKLSKGAIVNVPAKESQPGVAGGRTRQRVNLDEILNKLIVRTTALFSIIGMYRIATRF